MNSILAGPANLVTSVRALLVAILAAIVMNGDLPAPAVCMVIAGCAAALDGVDGWVARRTRTASDFGARFDLEVDAALIMILSALVWRYGKAGWWVLTSGLLRYLFVAAAAVWPWLKEPLEPSRRRQIMCVAQITALIVVMFPAVTPPLSSAITGAALAALAWSFLLDILWLRRRALVRPVTP